MIPEKSRSAKMRTEYPQDIHNGAKYPPCINKLSTRADREEGTSERESLEAAQDFLNHFKLQLFEKRTDMRSTFLSFLLCGSIGNPEKNAEKAEVRIRKGPPHDMTCRKKLRRAKGEKMKKHCQPLEACVSISGSAKRSNEEYDDFTGG